VCLFFGDRVYFEASDTVRV